MSKLSLIIKREFIAKVRNKSFIVMTFLSPLLFVGIAVFVGYLSAMKADLKTIAIHDETGLFAQEFKSDEEYKYVDLSSVNIKILKDSIVSESYEGLLLIPKATDNKALEKGIQYISNDFYNSGYFFFDYASHDHVTINYNKHHNEITKSTTNSYFDFV